jgi:hypothetical protein
MRSGTRFILSGLEAAPPERSARASTPLLELQLGVIAAYLAAHSLEVLA